MKRILLYCLVIASLATSCSKEISVETNGNGPGGGPGTGGGGGGSSSGNDTYQPVSKNSTWKYVLTGVFPGETTITSTGNTRVVNGLSCFVFTSTSTIANAAGEGLFAIKDHNYYTVQKGTSPNTGAAFDVNLLYLNDTASVGYKWSYEAGHGNGFTAIIDGAIITKGTTMTVEGKVYNDVIRTEMVLKYDIPMLGVLTFATYDYYVAKNIGIIKVDSKGDPVWGGGLLSEMNLVSHSIK
jgi:hypothetical protein